NAPARAGRVEPAILIGLAVEVRVDLAIDLDAVLEVRPDVDLVVVVAVVEPAQGLAGRVGHHPAAALFVLEQADLAAALLFGAGDGAFDAGLTGSKGEDLCRGGRGAGAAAPGQERRSAKTSPAPPAR